MKNPLAYLKHIVKDPINTIDEANARKKEIMPLLYSSVGVMALGLILQVAAGLDFMMIFSFIGLIGAGFCGFLFLVISSAKKRFEALTCNKCNFLADIKTPEEFGKYVSFDVVKDEAVFNGYSGSKEATNGVFSSVKVSASASAVLSVELTCPNCGEVKHLKYSATPFKCHIERKNVPVKDYADVRSAMEDLVRAIVNDYNNPEKKGNIPYTFHSSKNPNFENRYKFKGANNVDAHPEYLGVRIDYHKDVEEMLAHNFVLRELQGSLTDPAKAKK